MKLIIIEIDLPIQPVKAKEVSFGRTDKDFFLESVIASLINLVCPARTLQQTVAQCPISPQLTSNCSLLHATMKRAISLPHTYPSELLIVFLFVFSIPPFPGRGCEDIPTFITVERCRGLEERKKGTSVRQTDSSSLVCLLLLVQE